MRAPQDKQPVCRDGRLVSPSPTLIWVFDRLRGERA